jgi:hypothetical protein
MTSLPKITAKRQLKVSSIRYPSSPSQVGLVLLTKPLLVGWMEGFGRLCVRVGAPARMRVPLVVAITLFTVALKPLDVDLALPSLRLKTP